MDALRFSPVPDDHWFFSTDNVLGNENILNVLLDEGRKNAGKPRSPETRNFELREIREFLFELYGRDPFPAELRDGVVYFARTGRIRDYRP